MKTEANLLPDLPTGLLNSAFVFGTETAWPRKDALAVLEAIAGKIAVYGVEVWVPTPQGPYIPAPFIYTFTFEERPQEEPWDTFAKRSAQAAQAYIEEFKWDDRDDVHKTLIPFFNIEIARESPSTTQEELNAR